MTCAQSDVQEPDDELKRILDGIIAEPGMLKIEDPDPEC